MKKIIIALVILAIVAIGGYYFTTSGTQVNSETNQQLTQQTGQVEGITKTITLDASKFQYSPSEIKVNEGDRVKIVMNNIDTTHGIAIPDFGVSGKESVEFVANKKGTFTFHCPTFCGPGHKEMSGTLIVE